MSKRTRMLAFLALGSAGLLLLGFGVKGLLLRPLRALDDQIVQLRLKLGALQKERQAFLAADVQVRAAASQMFGPDTAAAEARLGAILTAQIVRVGLREADFTRIPVGRRRLPGADELGWTIQGEGGLRQVLDLLFLLQSDPRLHRIDALALGPASDAARVRVRFRYLTLVFNPAPDFKPPTALAEASLDSPARRRYDAIERRDLLRPFIPQIDGGHTAPPPPLSDPAQPTLAEARTLRVVSLSSWDGQPEVHLADSQRHRTVACRPGETLLDGELVAVDYRALPRPDKPGLLSYSRLIWRVGDDYWAVETGQTLADRRRLAPNELPPTLSPPPPAPPSP